MCIVTEKLNLEHFNQSNQTKPNQTKPNRTNRPSFKPTNQNKPNTMPLNPNALPYIPQAPLVNVQQLISYPFFQQRLDRFLYTQYRISDARVENLQIFMTNPPIQPKTKASTVFLAQYKGIPFLYEANRWEDPRTGMFVKV